MNASSRTVRIFLSSTFRDFAPERDLLVRKVFPELRRQCRARQVELVEVDLRWGITEAEAQQGKVLPICLAEIDRARPYFIGCLGERYGWVPEKAQYDLSLLLEQPWLEEHRGGKSVTELEILHGVLNNPKMAGRALFYFRDPKWSRKQGGACLSESPQDKTKLDALKDRIRQSGFPVVEDYRNPRALADQVQSDLWRLIEETYPADAVPDALSLERQRHEAYGATRQRLYLGGEVYFKALDQAIQSEASTPVLITGQSGGGKSALLANWVARWRREQPKTVLILHHLGSGVDAADPVRLAVRLMQEIARLTGEEFKPESDPEKQLEQLPQWLATGGAWAQREGRELGLVLDGLDKVSDRKDLRWFPSFLPPGVKLVASCLEGAILQAAKGRLAWRAIAVKPFTRADQVRFIGEYLGRYRKALTPKQTKTLQSHPLSGNPLFLLTVLEELRVFGVHEQLEQRLQTLLSPPPSKGEGEAPTVDDVFEHVLARVEEDLGKKLVRAAVEAIWASRGGLLREELLAVAQLTPAAWAALQNALDEGLYESGGRISFGHDYLRKAVEDRYGLRGRRKQNVHRRLAEYFAGLPVDARVAEELPWQWEQAGEKEKLKACLTDREMFVALQQRDEYELLGYWVRLGGDIGLAYKDAWNEWASIEDAVASYASPLVHFLWTSGSYSAFLISLAREHWLHQISRQGNGHPETLQSLEALYRSIQSVKDLSARDGFALGDKEMAELVLVAQQFGLETRESNFDHDLDRHMVHRVFELARQHLGWGHQMTLDGALALATHLSYQSYLGSLSGTKDVRGLVAEVERLIHEVVLHAEKNLGFKSPLTLRAISAMANHHLEQGRVSQARPLLERAVKGAEEVLGLSHPNTLQIRALQCECLLHDNEPLDLVLAEMLELMITAHGALGARHPMVRSFVDVVSDLLSKLQQPSLETIEGVDAGSTSTDYALVVRHLHWHFAGRFARLISVLREVVKFLRQGKHWREVIRKTVTLSRFVVVGSRLETGPKHEQVFVDMVDLADAMVSEAHCLEGWLDDDAENMLREALQGLASAAGVKHPLYMTCAVKLADLLCDPYLYDKHKPQAIDHGEAINLYSLVVNVIAESEVEWQFTLLDVMERFSDCLCKKRVTLAISRIINGRNPTLLSRSEKELSQQKPVDERSTPIDQVNFDKAMACIRSFVSAGNGTGRRHDSFHSDWGSGNSVRYNLACYECLSGNLDEAKRLLAEDIAADPEKKEQALQDSDLEAIREFIKRL